MNQSHLNTICSKMQLGKSIGEPLSVYGCRGGSFMWRVSSDLGCYAVKQLSPEIDLTNDCVISQYEMSETIAYQYNQKGIRTVSAIRNSGKHLTIIDNIGYLVYPWMDSYTLKKNEVSEKHALKIAIIIAQLHNCNMIVPAIKQPRFDIHGEQKIINVVDQSLLLNCPFADYLRDNQSLILSVNERYITALPCLKQETIVTHGDLDQLNILWDNLDQPTLIDWESLKLMNRTQDIIRASLGWSGIGTDRFSPSIYKKMLNIYVTSAGSLDQSHIVAGFYSVFGSMINWTLYNIEKYYGSTAQQDINSACNEVIWAIATIKRLNTFI